MYGQLAVYGFFLYSFGPAQPLLRDEQGTSHTVAGLHGTALALGAILAGSTNTRLAHRYGSQRASWIGTVIFAIGIIDLIAFRSLTFTLLGALVTGTGGSIAINSATTVFHEHLPTKMAEKALAEGNAFAALFGALGTTLVGLLAASRFGWRGGLFLGLIGILVTRFAIYRKPIESHVPNPNGRSSGTLPRRFWIGWITIVTVVGIEFGSSFWAAALIHARTGANASNSTMTVMILALCMGIGRYAGSRGLHKASLDRLLIFFLIITAVGFAFFWTANSTLIAFLGLGLVGLGISMQYPLAISRLIRLSDHRPDLALGRASLGAGTAIGLSPLLLGIMGDHIGIQKAYLLIPALIVVGIISVIASPTHAMLATDASK
ncbi:putative transporter [mine drainage metagenome]|uniref:Putative transporter n=1 Tax=mine drainage metagenome TaxID=410659 RepID=A0A1J5Q443_9ZZZZ